MLDVPRAIEKIRGQVFQAAEAIEALLDRSGSETIPDRLAPGAFISGVFHQWYPLDATGHLLQADAHAVFDRFWQLARAILADAVPPKQAVLEKALPEIRRLIDQDPRRAIAFDVARLRAYKALLDVLHVVESLAADSPTLLVVPDTSAVLDAPNLEAFDFGERDVEVIVAPVLLGELNDIKDDVRKDREVRERARSVIRQLRDYRARGNITRGVDGYQGVRIRALPTEPRMSESLAWLDPEVNDDRLIASVLEVMRRNLGSRVVLVTSDLNQQNKADAAGIVYVDPPASTPRQGPVDGR